MTSTSIFLMRMQISLLFLFSFYYSNLPSLHTPSFYTLFDLILYLPSPNHSFFVLEVALWFVLISAFLPHLFLQKISLFDFTSHKKSHFLSNLRSDIKISITVFRRQIRIFWQNLVNIFHSKEFQDLNYIRNLQII